MDLFDVAPTRMADPFARGARLPMSVETRNSTYTVTECALRVDEAPMVYVSCERGTFAGQGWMVPRSSVLLTRSVFVAGDLTTTRPVKVNGYDVAETWPVDYSCSYHHECSPAKRNCEQWAGDPS